MERDLNKICTAIGIVSNVDVSTQASDILKAINGTTEQFNIGGGSVQCLNPIVVQSLTSITMSSTMGNYPVTFAVATANHTYSGDFTIDLTDRGADFTITTQSEGFEDAVYTGYLNLLSNLTRLALDTTNQQVVAVEAPAGSSFVATIDGNPVSFPYTYTASDSGKTIIVECTCVGYTQVTLSLEIFNAAVESGKIKWELSVAAPTYDCGDLTASNYFSPKLFFIWGRSGATKTTRDLSSGLTGDTSWTNSYASTSQYYAIAYNDNSYTGSGGLTVTQANTMRGTYASFFSQKMELQVLFADSTIEVYRWNSVFEFVTGLAYDTVVDHTVTRTLVDFSDPSYGSNTLYQNRWIFGHKYVSGGSIAKEIAGFYLKMS